MQSVTLQEARKILKDKAALRVIANKTEPVLKLPAEVSARQDKLVDLEVTIRKYERVGGFERKK